MHTLSRSARSILAAALNSFRSRSLLLNDDEYLGSVGGGIGRAAITGLSCVLLALWMPAVGCGALLVKLAIYAPKVCGYSSRYKSVWNLFLCVLSFSGSGRRTVSHTKQGTHRISWEMGVIVGRSELYRVKRERASLAGRVADRLLVSMVGCLARVSILAVVAIAFVLVCSFFCFLFLFCMLFKIDRCNTVLWVRVAVACAVILRRALNGIFVLPMMPCSICYYLIR